MKKSTKRVLTVFLSVLLFFGAVFGGLELSVAYAKNNGAWFPDYEKQSIDEVLEKSELTEEDYAFLYAQTGLTKLGIDGLIASDRKKTIRSIQTHYFAEYRLSHKEFAPYIFIEKKGDYGVLCQLEDGDLIVSASTCAGGFRIGHSALVVDAEKGAVLESIQIGIDSSIASAISETDMSTYMVLRPTGIPKETRAKVAKYAEAELVGKPYGLTVGIFSEKFPTEMKKTQCAHLCWYAYKKYGYDLDSNGGGLVKPRDIANSPYLEVVQIFGFDPEKLWK